jgi:PRTRC genetic system ThiF family protein
MPITLPASYVNRELKIVVVGAGGTGSALISELYQMCFLLKALTEDSVSLNVTVYDPDDVSFTNVGRQNFWAHQVGLNKAQVLVDQFNAYGNMSWTAKPLAFKPEDLTDDVDFLITCTDSASFRGQLGKYFSDVDKSWYWLDTGNGESTSQIILGHLGKRNKTLMNVYDFYPELADMKDEPTNSCSHHEAIERQSYGINKKTALEATQMLWQLLRFGTLSYQGCFVDLKTGKTEPILV